MSNVSNNLLLSANAFAKCAPNISTNIRQCGSVTLCSGRAMTLDDLTGAYTKSGDYMIMEALFKADIEVKMCDTVTNDLYDFFMSNKMAKKAQIDDSNPEERRIMPFVKVKRPDAINNSYWKFSSGQANGGNWQMDVSSTGSVPPDVRSFPVDMRIFATGRTSGGVETHTAWTVVSATLINNAVRVVASSLNTGSNLPSAALASPATGIITRGTANKSDSEKYCAEPPAYMNKNMFLSWVETSRVSFCTSKKYEEYRAMLLRNNALYREFGDLDSTEKNRQIMADWQRTQLQQMFWGKPGSIYQNAHDFDQLSDITSYGGGAFSVNEGVCVGKRANMVGIYEQLYECGRVYDAQGASLNLIAVFNELYNIMRVYESSGRGTMKSVDLFTDSLTAQLIMQAMLDYYNNQQPSGSNIYKINVDVNQPYKDGEFGFRWQSFKLSYPNGLTVNIVTHNFFDDILTASAAAGLNTNAGAGRKLWILDMGGIYPGILGTNRKVNNTGDLKALAAIDSSYACVMRVDTTENTLISVTGTMIVECPRASLLIENFINTKPVVTAPGSLVYPATTTTTTTTSS